ncbi:hypothetical protein ABVT39_022616 [Epinephelus coioides]
MLVYGTPPKCPTNPFQTADLPNMSILPAVDCGLHAAVRLSSVAAATRRFITTTTNNEEDSDAAWGGVGAELSQQQLMLVYSTPPKCPTNPFQTADLPNMSILPAVDCGLHAAVQLSRFITTTTNKEEDSE